MTKYLVLVFLLATTTVIYERTPATDEIIVYDFSGEDDDRIIIHTSTGYEEPDELSETSADQTQYFIPFPRPFWTY